MYINETEVDLTPLYQDIAQSFNTANNATGAAPIDTIFMFKTLSVIYFFSFCVSMLFYAGKVTLHWLAGDKCIPELSGELGF